MGPDGPWSWRWSIHLSWRVVPRIRLPKENVLDVFESVRRWCEATTFACAKNKNSDFVPRMDIDTGPHSTGRHLEHVRKRVGQSTIEIA